MKKFTLFTLTGLCLTMGGAVFANKNLWQTYKGSQVPTSNPKSHLPLAFDVMKLDQQGIKNLLLTAGNTPEQGVEISLPNTEGGFETFNVWKTPVMEEALQDSHPDIHTYTGVQVNDAEITAKISYTEMGLFARTYSYRVEKSFFIEPYGYDPNGYYVVALNRDYQSGLTISQPCNPDGIASLAEEGATTLNPNGTGSVALRTHGSIRREYRAVFAATGEYAQLVTGSTTPTVSQILSIVSATINNANGVWEREMSVSLKMVSSNTAVLYTDGTVDPYTDNQNNVAIDENQTNVDNVVGATNYDVGHLFNTAGGGLAGLGVICSGSKARGVSGSGGPNDIGTVIHEVGHQMGAGHTFTSASGGCSGNGMAESAFEPGSGTTIMSYNGACAADNTPSVSTDYYNRFNLQQMHDFLISGGSLCGSTTAGQTPVIMPNLSKFYRIPANTPFELIAPEATKTVASNSTTTYCWEQADKGTIDMVEANGGSATSGPIFMSLDPDTNRVRVFPSYEKLAQNQYSSIGMRLPMVTRDLTFKVTARSIATDGFGTHNIIDSVVKLKAIAPGGFRVTAPSTNVTWEPGQNYNVGWNVANTMTPSDSIMAGFVNIYLSLDGGLSFPLIMATNVPNNGSYNIQAPDLYTTQARIKVKAVGNVFFDVSHTNFKVNGNPVSVRGVDFSSNIDVYPNPASSELNVAIKGQTGDYNLVLLNALGQEVWKGTIKNNLTIPVANLSRGLYFLHIQDIKAGKYGTKQVSLQ